MKAEMAPQPLVTFDEKEHAEEECEQCDDESGRDYYTVMAERCPPRE